MVLALSVAIENAEKFHVLAKIHKKSKIFLLLDFYCLRYCGYNFHLKSSLLIGRSTT